VVRGGFWHTVESAAQTGSTNADLLLRAQDGAPEGLVLAAEEQTAGRGRRGRAWISPPHAALMFSLLLRPAPVPPARWGWLPLLTGVAVVTTVREVSGVHATLKWPNDVLAVTVPGTPSSAVGKLAGILAEAAEGVVVVGVGLNVSTVPEEFPPPGPGALPATSLSAAGAVVLGRERLLGGILAAFEQRYLAWRDSRGNPAAIRAEYLGLCGTLGRQVRVELPGGQVLSGEAVDVDPDGRLVVRSSASEVAVAAGDVVHVRLPGAHASTAARQAAGTAGTRYRRSKSAVSGGTTRIVTANIQGSPAPSPGENHPPGPPRANRRRATSTPRPPSRITPSSVPRRYTHFW
jgi:BirA family biotin operon repressor/biotin-[acetyl-CoA-carboxylase] ligase